MPYLVRSACLIGYVDLARSVDLDPLLLLKDAGLDRDCLADPERKISVDAVRRLLNLSASAAHMDDFGLRLAEGRPLSFFGPVGLALRDATTLREALDAASRYLPLHREGVVMSLEKMGDTAIYRMMVLGGQSSPPRQSVEVGIGVWHRIIRQLLDDEQIRRPVWFSHSAPADMTAHQKYIRPLGRVRARLYRHPIRGSRSRHTIARSRSVDGAAREAVS